jgi:hypothetical protein
MNFILKTLNHHVTRLMPSPSLACVSVLHMQIIMISYPPRIQVQHSK